MKTDINKNLRKIGMAGMLFSAIIYTLVFLGAFEFQGSQGLNSLAFTSVLLIFSCLLFALSQPKAYLEMDFDQKCQFMAEELRAGKRQWYCINPYAPKFLIVPLRHRNLDEFGGGYHEPLSVEDVKKMLSMGNVQNVEYVKTILELSTFVQIGILLPGSIYKRKDNSFYQKTGDYYAFKVERSEITKRFSPTGDPPETFDFLELVHPVEESEEF